MSVKGQEARTAIHARKAATGGKNWLQGDREKF